MMFAVVGVLFSNSELCSSAECGRKWLFLQDHLNKLRGIDKDVVSFKPNMDELERYNQEVQEAMIFENRHTQYTMEVSEHLSSTRKIHGVVASLHSEFVSMNHGQYLLSRRCVLAGSSC